jgi:hypothetical protein
VLRLVSSPSKICSPPSNASHRHYKRCAHICPVGAPPFRRRDRDGVPPEAAAAAALRAPAPAAREPFLAVAGVPRRPGHARVRRPPRRLLPLLRLLLLGRLCGRGRSPEPRALRLHPFPCKFRQPLTFPSAVFASRCAAGSGPIGGSGVEGSLGIRF